MMIQSIFSPTPLVLSAVLAIAMASPLRATPPPDPLNLYAVGNSVTGVVKFNLVEQMVEAEGYEFDYEIVGAAGASLALIWNSPDLQNRFKTEIAAKPYHFLSLQSHYNSEGGLEGELVAANNFIDYAKGIHPDIVVIVYSRYGKNYGGDYSELWSTPYPGSGWQYMDTRDFFEQMTERLRVDHPDLEVRMAPVGEVYYEIDQQMKAGLIPPYDSVYNWFIDAIHAGPNGSYIAGLTFFTLLYGTDPALLPTATSSDLYGVPENEGDLIEAAVWDVVPSVPYANLASSAPLKIATVYFPNALSAHSYELALAARYGDGDYSWSGLSLPPGLSLSADGVLAGTLGSAGTFDLSVQVTDGLGETAMLDTQLAVETDTAPIPRIEYLPTVKLGEYFHHRLASDGGNFQKTWKVAGGRLPVGVELLANGTLQGAAGITGHYTFDASVTDSDPENPETNSETYVLRVSNPVEKLTAAHWVDTPPTLDGDASDAASPDRIPAHG